jgi:hypothetical protein
MLSLMLMLAAEPLAGAATPPPAEPTVRMINAEATMRAVDQSLDAARRDCKNGELLQARTGRATQPPGQVLNDLMFRQGDPLSLTLLLERRIGQCSVPVSYDLTTPGGGLPRFPTRSE